MQVHSIMGDNSVPVEAPPIETLVLSVSERVASIAYRYSNNEAGSEQEDLYSIGMTEAIEAMSRYLPSLGPLSQNKQIGYLVVAARHRMVAHHRRGHSDIMCRPSQVRSAAPVLSLDGDPDGFSLYNEVASPDLLPTASPTGERFGLLYEILDTLPAHLREVVCMRYGLCGHGEHRPYEIAGVLKISQDVVNGRLRIALRQLRQHTELLSLVGTSSFPQEPIEDECMPIEAPGGVGGDRVPVDPVLAGQGDESEDLERVQREFEAVPSYVSRFANGREEA